MVKKQEALHATDPLANKSSAVAAAEDSFYQAVCRLGLLLLVSSVGLF
jgi:hypothetical protein